MIYSLCNDLKHYYLYESHFKIPLYLQFANHELKNTLYEEA